jgi:hypothetical protein
MAVEAIRTASRRPPWREHVLYLGLVALLVATTLNGLTVDWRVLGSDITLRPDQLVIVLLFPLLVLESLRGGVRVRLILFDWVVLAFLVSNGVASLLFSPARNASLKGTLLLACYGGMYFAVRQILANRAEWLPRASNWVLGLGIAQAAYSIVALLLYTRGHVIGGVQIGHLSEASVATEGTFWEANILGAYLCLIALFLAVRYLFRSTTDAGTIYVAGFFLASVALPLTVTRAAGGALVLGLGGLLAILFAQRQTIAAWRTRATAVLVTLACAVLLTATVMNSLVSTASSYPNLLMERWIPSRWMSAGADREVASAHPAPQRGMATGRPRGEASSVRTTGSDRAAADSREPSEPRAVVQASRSSVDGRVQAWVLALRAWRERPILGHGTLAGTSIIKEGWWYSSLVQALYDTGLLGFGILLWMHVAAIALPVRVWRRARGGPMQANLLGFAVGNAVLLLTSQFSSFWFVGFPWVFLGVTMGAVAVGSTVKRQPA